MYNHGSNNNRLGVPRYASEVEGYAKPDDHSRSPLDQRENEGKRDGSRVFECRFFDLV
jgi:hypothetical protein